jgi:hypothetical protein
MPASGQTFDSAHLHNTYTQIYIYRYGQLKGSGIIYSIAIDGKKIGMLRNNGYIVKNVSPGMHVVKMEVGQGVDSINEKMIRIGIGQKYFLRADDNSGMTNASAAMATVSALHATLVRGAPVYSGMVNQFNLVSVPSRIAIQELQSLHLSD